MRKVFTLLALVAVIGPWGGDSRAQSYPSKPIKVIVPYPAGGSADLATRVITQKMGEMMGQPFALDFRPGAGARIGVEAVAKSAPDGYTLGFTTPAPLCIAPSVFKSVPYDPVKSFEPVVMLTHAPFLVTVGASVQATTLRQLIERDKAAPGKLNFVSFGVGSMLQFMGENFNAVTGTKLVHVPYKGAAPGLIALLGGEAHVIFDQLASLKPANYSAGKLRALAILAPKRLAQLPDVPTATELGYKGIDGAVWNALIAPAGTSLETVRRLNAVAQKALTDKKVVEVLVDQNAQIIDGGPPEVLAAAIRDDLVKWTRIIKATGFKPE
ncbi:MAG: tripartite tricarboxylate transporter substrate binding protein [Burkholderiales bacterium]|nr:tripartite tricarboxylate transporter substrate binding protein [Burkholderiales bacterium]